MYKLLDFQNLKACLSANGCNNDFYNTANSVLSRAFDCRFDSKAELSNFINSQLDYDDFIIEQDEFIDTVNDIIIVVSEFYNLK